VVGGIALVLHRDLGDIFLLQPVALHVSVHLQGEDPQQVRAEGAFGEVVEDGEEGALRVRLHRRHLLFAHDQANVEQPRGHVVPALGGCKDTRAASHVAAHVGLAPPAGSVRKPLGLHVHAVEGIRGGAHDHGLHLVQREFARFERLAGGLEGEFPSRFKRAADELGHPRAYDCHTSHSHASLLDLIQKLFTTKTSEITECLWFH
jgi:hypothetical protein